MGCRLIILFFMVALIPLKLKAQDAGGEKPELNNHMFIPLTDFNSAFPKTRITVPIGLGTTSNFDFPLLEDIDTLGNAKGDMLFVQLGFGYSQRIRDWVSFYMNAGLAARLGTNVESILSQGFNTVIQVELGSVIRLYRTDRTTLSISVSVNNYNANIIDIRAFVKDVVNGIPDPEVVRAHCRRWITFCLGHQRTDRFQGRKHVALR